VVAPVRETAAQALGAAVQPLAVPPLAALLAMLRRLAGSGQWEARHSGLLALKYVVAARADAAAALLPHALAIAQTGLQVLQGRLSWFDTRCSTYSSQGSSALLPTCRT